MLGRRFISFFKKPPSSNISSSGKPPEDGKSSKWMVKKGISYLLITITGGVALSAVDDLAIYYGCSSKALEKAIKNQTLVEAIGQPIKKGPWYDASLSLTHKRHSVACTFPVFGPRGNGTLQLKAIRNEDATWFPFIKARDWEILVLEAQLNVPDSEENQQTIRVTITDSSFSPPPTADSEIISDSL
ncbi:hypothetical protein QQ045_022133 [Rhodiola kirilowii]